MALPTIESPKYSVRLPSTGKTIEYRPFLVKEEKVLLMAQESGSPREMVTAMKDIIKACTFNKVDPNALTSYDLEFMFLKLRAKSVGETSTIKIKCDKCEAFTPVDVDIDNVTLDVPQDKVNIMLTDTVGITMRHIRVRDMGNLTDTKDQGDLINDTVIASIESIFDADHVYPTDTEKKEELVKFVNSLNRAQMKEIESYIANTPKVSCDVKFKCCNGECGHENKVSLTGIQSFFD
jgi:hypothetical protein